MHHLLTPPLVNDVADLITEIRGRLLVCARTSDSDIAQSEYRSWQERIFMLTEAAGSEPLSGSLSGLANELKALEAARPETRNASLLAVLDGIGCIESVFSDVAEDSNDALLNISDFVESSIDGLVPASSRPLAGQSETYADDDFDAELLEIFSAEAEELLGNIDNSLAALAEEPGNSDALWEIRRNAHTFKGSAGIVGLDAPSRLAHRIEDMLDRVAESDIRAGVAIFDLLKRAADTLRSVTLNCGSPVDAIALAGLHAEFDHALADLASFAASSTAAAEPQELEHAGPQSEQLIDATDVTGTGSSPVDETRSERRGSIVRVPLTKLDELSAALQEILVTGSAIERNMRELRHQISELTITSRRVLTASSKLENSFEAEMLGSPGGRRTGTASAGDRTGLDVLEFDRYTEFHQNSRQLSEAAGDTAAINNALDEIRTGLESLIDRQNYSIRRLKEGLVHIRLVEFGTMKTRLTRTARVTAEEEGREVRVEVLNEHTEVDTQMLDALTEPLLHLIRNAVVHGIEPPETRRLLGKPEVGTISISLEDHITHAALTVSDDGSGISTAKLRERAFGMSVSPADLAVTAAENDPIDLIFVPGLTTASGLSLRAGRGVGMSIVKASIEGLGGTISVETRPLAGTTFRIRIPLKMAVIDSVVVGVGDHTVAMPAAKVLSVRFASSCVTVQNGNRLETTYDGEVVTVTDLREPRRTEDAMQQDPVIVFVQKNGGTRAAVLVDEIIRTEELALRSLGFPLNLVRGLLGASVTGDSEVLPMLDLDSVIADGTRPSLDRSADAADPKPSRPIILIVDDSPSVRHTTTKIVEHAGWKAITARDGVEAIDVLERREQLPAVVLSDIEMPRMDGFELVKQLRADERFRDLPVIVITSRSGDKHRELAEEIGISAFLSKPFNEAELIGLASELSGVVPQPE